MSGAQKPVRVAVIGAGYLGRFHAEKYRALQEAELIAVCDIVPEQAAAVAEQTGAHPVTDYRDILDRVEAVSIVVPTDKHYAVARDCLMAGLDILVEKPVTETLTQADDLIRLAAQKNRIFMVGHLERFNPAITRLRELQLRPGFIEVERLGPFKQRVADTDVVRDLMIHDLDIVLGLVKSEVRSVSAMGLSVLSRKIDIANARIEFDNGCIADLTASRVSVGSGVRKIKIFQHESYISIDYQNQRMAVFTLDQDETKNPMERIRIEELKLDSADALALEIKSFINSVTNRTAPAVSGEDGRRALAAAILVTEAVSRTPGPEAL